MASRRLKFSDEIRVAIERSGLSRYAIWKATGIDQAALCRFVHGDVGMSLDTLDILADLLDLHAVQGGGDSKGK